MSAAAAGAREVTAAGARAEPSSSRWLVAVAVAMGAMLEIVDTSIVNVALVDIRASLGVTLAETSWVVSSYAVANVIILPMSAWLGKRFGKKRYFLFSLVGFVLASMLCGVATSLPMLIVARALQGLTGGGLLAKAQAILYETFPPEEQAMAQALFGAVVIAGPVIGPTLGGYIVTHVGWRWIFFVNLPLGILATMAVVAFLPRDRIDRTGLGSVDWLGIALLAVGLGSLQTFLEEGQSHQWFQSGLVVVLGAMAAMGILAFIVRELTTDHPVVDLRVLRHRSLWAGSLLSVMVGMSLYGALFAVPIFAQNVMGQTPQQTGVMLLPGALASALAMPFAGRLSRRIDPRVMLVMGALILAAALQMMVPLSPQTGEEDFFWPLIVRSIGTVFMFLPLTLATLSPLPRNEVAAATGFFNLTRQLGGSIGVALLTTILSDRIALHRANLVTHLQLTDPVVQGRLDAMTAAFHGRGFDTGRAHDMALALIDGSVSQQASIMSFSDIFWLVSVLVVCFVPFIFLLGRSKRGGAAPSGAH